MSILFTLSGAVDSVTFNHDEATDTDTMKPYYSIEIGSERSAFGRIKQQVRPGKRYTKEYAMVLPLSKYISFINLLTDQSDNYFISYTTAPELLVNDSSVLVTNDFAVAVDYSEPESVAGDVETLYKFMLSIMSVDLL